MIDFDKIREEREERERQFKDSMQRIDAKVEAHNAEQQAIFEQWARKTVNAKKAMAEELKEVDQEAEQRKKDIRRRYASDYGSQDWNSNLEDELRDLARNLKSHSE